jgi:GntR family transcriptional regulator
MRTEDQLPSVRQVAADYAVNPITVMKAYQLLVDDGVLEKKRGLGMFIREGAWQRLMEQERRVFLEVEWPRIRQRIQQLGLSPEELLGGPAAPSARDKEARHD